jgi:hypothetical protein
MFHILLLQIIHNTIFMTHLVVAKAKIAVTVAVTISVLK